MGKLSRRIRGTVLLLEAPEREGARVPGFEIGNMTVLEYERRFQDLSIFVTIHLLTEHHRVEQFRDGLRQELKLILVAMQF